MSLSSIVLSSGLEVHNVSQPTPSSSVKKSSPELTPSFTDSSIGSSNSTISTNSKVIPMMESKRSKSMRIYFEQETLQIVERFVDRNKHDFTVKDLNERLKDYNHTRLKPKLLNTSTSSQNQSSLLTSSNLNINRIKSPLNSIKSSASLFSDDSGPRVNNLDLFSENYKLMRPTKKKNKNSYSKRLVIEYKYPQGINDDHLKWLVEEDD